MVCDGCNYFSFWATFCPFTPPNSLKNKNLKKMKKQPGDIIILHKCTKNYDKMMHDSWDMVHDRCNRYFSFWAIFCTFTPLKAQKLKILKKWKNLWRYHHFTYVYQKIWSDDVRFLRYAARRMDEQMDGRTDGKSDMWRWVPHLKIIQLCWIRLSLIAARIAW